MDPAHKPVLLAAALELLDVKPGGFYVDGTLGLGGHAREILRASAPARHAARRSTAIPSRSSSRARRSQPFGARAELAHADFRELPELLRGREPDGILLDLGVSSLQLDTPERGFSFRQAGPLDMRLDRTHGITAAELVNRLPERELADLIHRYGEERASRRIARELVAARRRQRFTTTLELARSGAARGRPRSAAASTPRRAPSRRCASTSTASWKAWTGRWTRPRARLAPGGRLAVIAFHSLEDREVKHTFRTLAGEGFQLLTRKPVRPDADELRVNPRARSARLRGLLRPRALPEAA